MLGDFLSQGVAQLNHLRWQCTATEQREVDASSWPSQREGWQGYAVFCRVGNSDRMADEERNAIPALYYEVLW